MNKDMFVQSLTLYKSFLDRSHRLSEEFKISLFEYETEMWRAYDHLLKCFLTKDQYDWVIWWLLERISMDGTINRVYHKNGNEIVIDTIEDLFEFITKLNKQKEK